MESFHKFTIFGYNTIVVKDTLNHARETIEEDEVYGERLVVVVKGEVEAKGEVSFTNTIPRVVYYILH